MASFRIALITDSTCDIPDNLLHEYDITYLPCYILWGGESQLDRQELSAETFYRRLTTDPAPIVFGERVYVYIGHDSDRALDDAFLMRDYKCYSTTDMANWTDHGVVLATKSIGWSGGDASAAHVTARNGRFYYYTSTQGPGGVCVGLAVASEPTGPFTDIGQPLIAVSRMTGCNATHGWRGLDPAMKAAVPLIRSITETG